MANPYANPTPLRPGMQGRIMGRDYTVKGRVVMGVMEEGEHYYWHEFQLVAADGEVLYLEYDAGTWKAMRPFMPPSPIGPMEAPALHSGTSINLDGNSALVTKNSTGTVYFSEGDLTFDVNHGSHVHYLDAGFGNRLYNVQWTEDEVEFFRGQTMGERDVLEGFGLVRELNELDRLRMKKRSQTIFATVCLVCSLLSLFMWAISGSSGRVISSANHSLMAVGAEGIRFGPVALDPANRVHRMVIHSKMTQASAWVSGVLETGDEIELLGTQYDFWDESGYDDGPWHEWELRAQSDFVIKEKNPYYVRLYVERDTRGGSYQDVGYELRGGVIYPRYYATFGIIMFFVAMLFYILPNRSKLKEMAESADD